MKKSIALGIGVGLAAYAAGIARLAPTEGYSLPEHVTEIGGFIKNMHATTGGQLAEGVAILFGAITGGISAVYEKIRPRYRY